MDWLQHNLRNGLDISTDILALRLIIAFLFGVIIAQLYRRTQGRAGGRFEAFTSTLVLLAILIALVTQVIGNSVARAFSLVGALSLVRFRTEVQDTRDTALCDLRGGDRNGNRRRPSPGRSSWTAGGGYRSRRHPANGCARYR